MIIDVTQRIKDMMETSRKKADNEAWALKAKERSDAIDYYNGDQIKHLEEYLGSIMSLRGDELLTTFSNITRKIINGTSLTYINPPNRYRNNKADDKYNKWTRDKDNTMLTADRITSLIDYVGVRVVWDDQKKKYRYRLLKQDVYFRLDRYGEDLEAVWYRIEAMGIDKKKNETMWEYWDNEIKCIVDDEGKPSKDQQAYGFEDNVNPYGIIPIAILSKKDTLAYDLINANRNINALLTLLNELIKFRSFGIPWMTGDGTADKVTLSYKYMLKVADPNAKFGMLDMQTNIDQVVNAIKFEINTICENWGISFSWSLEGNVSGFSLMVQNIELYDNIRVDNAKRRIWEENIYDIEMAITKVKNPPEFSIDFAEYTLPVNKDEQIKWEMYLLNTGQTNPVDLMREKDPDLNEAEAKKQYEANLEMMKKNTEATTPEQPSTNPFENL